MFGSLCIDTGMCSLCMRRARSTHRRPGAIANASISTPLLRGGSSEYRRRVEFD